MGILDAPARRSSGASPVAALMAALKDGQQSASIHVLSDSTGAGDKWARRLITLLCARFPTYEGRDATTWLDSTQKYDMAPTSLVAPPSGSSRYLQCGTNTARHPGDGTALTDIDVQVKLSLATALPAATTAPVSRYYAGGNRGFICYINTNGTLSMQWTADGTTAIFGAGSAVIPFVANTQIWLRWTLKVNNGSGGYTLTYRYSTDSRTTWTTSATQTGGSTTTLFNPAGDYELGGWNGGANPLVGKIYEVSISNGDTDQSSVVSTLVDHWVPSGSGVTINGSPRLSLVNGGQPGAALTYLNDATRCPKMTLKGYNTLAVMLNTSHNDLTRRGATYLADWDLWLTRLRANLPYAGLVVTTQNPKTSPASYIQEHRIRQDDIRMWAAKNGATFIDAYRAFQDDGRAMSLLVDPADGVHPLSTGYDLWAAKAYAAFSAAA